MTEPAAVRNVPVFLYGSYLDPETVAQHGVTLPPLSSCILHGFRLLIDPIARIAPDPDHRVFGAVVQLAPDALDALYSTELMRPYRPLPIWVQQVDRSLLAALTYTPASAPPGMKQPRHYVEKLVRTCEELGFPAVYLSEIANWRTPRRDDELVDD